MNDQASAALDAIFVPMWRIGFLINAGGRTHVRQIARADMVPLRQKVKLNLVKQR
jgi:hypothetical protein